METIKRTMRWATYGFVISACGWSLWLVEMNWRVAGVREPFGVGEWLNFMLLFALPLGAGAGAALALALGAVRFAWGFK